MAQPVWSRWFLNLMCWSYVFLFSLIADPFADASKGDDWLPAGTEDSIHIRIQQRNGRKTLTTVQGIADDYDKKKLVKAFKKVNPQMSFSICSTCSCQWQSLNISFIFDRNLLAMVPLLNTLNTER